MYSKHEIGEAEHRAWFAQMQHDQKSRWYIHEDDQGTPDGVVYFTQYLPENRSSFWGFYAAPDAPPGTGTKLGIDALDEAFHGLRLHKLNAEALASNQRSLRFHEKLGFQQEGLFREFHFDGERYVDVVRLGLLASEWPEKRAKILQHIAKLNVFHHSDKGAQT